MTLMRGGGEATDLPDPFIPSLTALLWSLQLRSLGLLLLDLRGREHRRPSHRCPSEPAPGSRLGRHGREVSKARS